MSRQDVDSRTRNDHDDGRRLSRARSCEGLGTAIALALAGGDGAGRRRWPSRARRPPRRRVQADGLPLRPQRRAHGRLDAQGRGDRASSCPAILEPLEPFQDDLLVLSGLAQDNAGRRATAAATTPGRSACFLTGVQPLKTDGANIRVGDLGRPGRRAEDRRPDPVPSLELGCERGGQAGNCDSGYSCAYSSNISWRSATTPMAKEINPRLVFERLFAGRGTTARRPSRASASSTSKSILDFVARGRPAAPQPPRA